MLSRWKVVPVPQPRKPDLGLSAFLSTGGDGSSVKQRQKRGVPSLQLGSGPASQRLLRGWQTSLVLLCHQLQPRRQLCREALKLPLRLALCLWALVLLLLVLSHLQANLWPQLLLSRCYPGRCHCRQDLPLLCSLCPLLGPWLPPCQLVCLFPQVGWGCPLCCPHLQVGMGFPVCPLLHCSLLVFQYL